MSDHPANGIDTSIRERYEALLTRLSAIVGRGAAEKGTARLAAAVAAVPEIPLDAAVAALMPTVGESLRRQAAQAWADWQRVDVFAFPQTMIDRRESNWKRLVSAAEAAELCAKSEWARERLIGYAKQKGIVLLVLPSLAVEGWDKAGRPAVSLCPQCGHALTDAPAEAEDADCGLGAIDAGRVCERCEFDERTHHKPTSRGSDRPFIG